MIKNGFLVLAISLLVACAGSVEQSYAQNQVIIGPSEYEKFGVLFSYGKMQAFPTSNMVTARVPIEHSGGTLSRLSLELRRAGELLTSVPIEGYVIGGNPHRTHEFYLGENQEKNASLKAIYKHSATDYRSVIITLPSFE